MSPRIPTYRLHRATGLAVVTLDGKDHYLGRHGSPESKAEYDRLVADWMSRGRKLDEDGGRRITVRKLAERYASFAEGYYRKGGEPTSQYRSVKLVADDLAAFAGDERAIAFGPARLLALRARWEETLARRTINDRVSIVKRMFRWASAREILPATAYAGLLPVRGLARGRSKAREMPPVLPVSREHVEAVAAFLGPPWSILIEVQEATGMRPGEAVSIRPCDVDRSDDIWCYTPGSHKTEHHEKSRSVFLGPKAQALLDPLLDGPAGRPVFTLRCGTGAGGTFTVKAYGALVTRACRKLGIPPWHPSQLRHNAATAIRARYGIEASRAVLGHSEASTTAIYAERDSESAKRIAREIG